MSKLLSMSTDFVWNRSDSDPKTCLKLKIKSPRNVIMQSHHNGNYSYVIVFITKFETVHTSIIILTIAVLITITLSCCYGSF